MTVDPIVAALATGRAAAPSPIRVDAAPPATSFAATLSSTAAPATPSPATAAAAGDDPCCDGIVRPPAGSPARTSAALSSPLPAVDAPPRER